MDKVIHFEIPADDVTRAQDFYKNLFGWKISEVPGMNYYFVITTEVDEKNMAKEPGAINGGMLKRSVPHEPPVIVIGVSSVDEYLKKVEKMGGKVVLPKMSVGDFGLYARISDPEGNIIGLWQNKG